MIDDLTVVLVDTSTLTSAQVDKILNAVANLSLNRHYVYDDTVEGSIVEGDGFAILVQDYNDSNGDERYFALETFLDFCKLPYRVLSGGYSLPKKSRTRYRVDVACPFNIFSYRR